MLWERAICITLHGFEERQEGIRQLPFPVEFFYGADCRNETMESLDSVYDLQRREQFGRNHLTPPEIGCAISHREVAKLVAKSGRKTLILEDDAVLTGSIPGCAPDFDLAYLGYQQMNMTVPWPVRLKLMFYYPLVGNFESVRRIYAKGLNQDWIRAGWFNNAHAYILGSEAASYIVSLQTRIWLEADTALSYLARFSDLNAIAARRPAFVQKAGLPSSIGDRPSWRH